MSGAVWQVIRWLKGGMLVWGEAISTTHSLQHCHCQGGIFFPFYIPFFQSHKNACFQIIEIHELI